MSEEEILKIMKVAMDKIIKQYPVNMNPQMSHKARKERNEGAKIEKKIEIKSTFLGYL